MKKHNNLFLMIALIFLLGLTQSILAQNAKYDNKGEIVSLRNLLPDKTGCEASRTFTGEISKIESFQKDDVLSYQFTLEMKSGKNEKFIAMISIGEISRDATPDDTIKPVAKDKISRGGVPDDTIKPVNRLFQKNQKLQIKARACGNGGHLTAEEINRLK